MDTFKNVAFLYFAPGYISLCKNEKVQGLRPKLEHGDWVEASGERDIKCVMLIHLVTQGTKKDGNAYDADDGICLGQGGYRNIFTWLPTGDQLDDEIVKICKERKSMSIVYQIHTTISLHEELPDGFYIRHYATINEEKEYLKSYDLYYTNDFNPLIAKISLLIKLLEGE